MNKWYHDQSSGDEWEIKSEEAEKFLSLLDPNARSFTFQTYDDNKDRRDEALARTLHGPLKTWEQELVIKYGFRGAAVAVSVNETDPMGRGKENIKRIRAVWCDYDAGKQKEPKTLTDLVKGFPLHPSIVVQTSPGNYHFYWLFDKPFDAADSNVFEGVMRRIVKDYGGDPGATGVTRVLRLPGFLHQKEPENRGKVYRVTIAGASGNRYTRGDIASAFRPIYKETVSKGLAMDPSGDWVVEKERIRGALRFVSADERGMWFKLGAAIYDASGGSVEGFEIWDSWCQSTKSDNYNSTAQAAYWAEEFESDREDRATIATIFYYARLGGWVDEGMAELPAPAVTEALPFQPGDLTKVAMASMRKSYAQLGLKPSDAQWNGIEAAIATMEAMANRTAEESVFLSSLDPGVGKTQSISHFIPALLKSAEYRELGAIVCVGRLKEVKRLADEMGLRNSDYSVFVSEMSDVGPELNALGNQDKTAAPVMFTTQQMIEARTKQSRSFDDTSEFYFGGRPRRVRIWDEAMLPGKPIFVNVTDIESMTRVIAKSRPILDKTLAGLTAEIRSKRKGDFVRIPAWRADTGVHAEAADVLYGRQDKAIKEAVKRLWSLGGKTVAIVKDAAGNSVVDYEETLLRDISPILVLDASGRIRQTYQLWERARGGLCRLPPAEKNYTNLTAHCWPRSGSKTAWRDDINGELATKIATEIAREPGRKCLVFHPKQAGDFQIDVPAKIETELPETLKSKTSYLHWGDHSASNDYRDIDKIILATVMFREESYYEGLTRASLGLPWNVNPNKKDVQQIRSGERADLILQSVCRSAVRKPLGDGCPPCDLYFFASPKHGIKNIIKRVFPGCKVVDWSAGTQELEGRRKEAFDLIMGRFAHMGVEELSSTSIARDLGMSNENWHTDVISHSSFLPTLEGKGIGFVRRPGRKGNVFKRIR